MDTVSATAIKRIVLEQSKRANVGHIGSCLSVAHILAALYSGVLNVADPDAEDRDRFILSKGHAALSLYAVLRLKGWLEDEQLNTFCGDGTLLNVHPEHELRGIDFTTGSLGHGLSIGAGAALAAQLQKSARRAFVLVSDAECNEGSLWEAIMFAASRKLSNLVAIVDLNGRQALGHTRDIIDLHPMAERWRAFGWDVAKVDGHDTNALTTCLNGIDTSQGPPTVMMANTTLGHGVSYMEGLVKWHYWPMSDEEYTQALAELDGQE
jgi:transketolase